MKIRYVFIIVGLIVISILLSSCGPSCQKDSASVLFAKSLTNEQLVKLFNDMQTHWRRFDSPDHGYTRGKEPVEFAYLNAAIVRPRDMNIMLEGCLDEFVYLGFQGFTLEQDDLMKSQKIEIEYHDKENIVREVLWENDEFKDKGK